MLRGACRGVSTALFFPPKGENYTRDEARAVCRQCPVREECLDYAFRTHMLYGIWGGLTENERRQLAQHRRLHPAT